MLATRRTLTPTREASQILGLASARWWGLHDADLDIPDHQASAQV